MKQQTTATRCLGCHEETKVHQVRAEKHQHRQCWKWLQSSRGSTAKWERVALNRIRCRKTKKQGGQGEGGWVGERASAKDEE
eukprot:6177498-Pleurochrysis_carterae.AAC.4